MPTPDKKLKIREAPRTNERQLNHDLPEMQIYTNPDKLDQI